MVKGSMIFTVFCNFLSANFTYPPMFSLLHLCIETAHSRGIQKPGEVTKSPVTAASAITQGKEVFSRQARLLQPPYFRLRTYLKPPGFSPPLPLSSFTPALAHIRASQPVTIFPCRGDHPSYKPSYQPSI